MKKSIYLTLIGLLIASLLIAQPRIKSVKEVATLMKKDNVILVSTRTAADYQKVHIMGAVHLDHKSLYGDLSMLKSPNELATILGASGISNSQTIILYDDGSGKYAGRLFWVLNYLGAEDVWILDGGMQAWKAGRKPVTKNPSKVASTTFSINVKADLLASMNDVKMAGSNTRVVDVRSPGEFAGTATTKLRPGHIPGAMNFEFTQVLNDNGTLKSEAELTSLFKAKGLTADKDIILYCESSVRAGIVFAAMKGLGYTSVKVYDGAYLEWQSNTSNEVAM